VEIFDLIDQPLRRRQWLLMKALETEPLADALALVKAVEEFLTAPAPTHPQPPASARLH
jgi:hypothetical protein